MPFTDFNITEHIENRRKSDSEFREAWDSSRMEYKILGDIIKLRKEKGITQVDIANKSGIKQQAISRIEKHENSPTLKTLCALADVLDFDIQLVPRH